MGGKIQSIIFDRKKWTLERAKKWLDKHFYRDDPDIKENHYRFRQIEPNKFKSFRTMDIGDGISFILGFSR